MANIKQTVDLTQGTLSNLIVEDGKLKLPNVNAPTFTRSSIAYKSDGSQVAANQPRFDVIDGVMGLMVEEGTKNVINQTDLADLHAWNPTNSRYNYAVQQADGWWRVNRYHPTSRLSASEVLVDKTYTVAAGQTWTVSFYFRTDGTISFTITFYTNNGHHPVTPTIIDLGNGIRKAIATYTFETGATYVREINIKDVNNGTWTYIDIKFGQLEQKPYATSFIDGTRAAETLTIPTAGVLNPSEGTIEVWVYVNDSIKQTAENRYIFNAPASTTGFISLYHKASTNEFVLHIKNESGNESSVSISDNDVPNGWHKFTVRWTSSEASLILDDGTKSASVSNPYLPQSFSTNATLGYSGTSGYINTMIDEIRISNKARSDDEIENIYYSQRPMPVDEWTTYLLRFDDNLNYGQGGYYISPEYDVSSVNKAARGKVYWQEDADGIQRIVYAKLDNQADWTQVTNGGLLPISAGDVLTNRKLQLKVKMLKVI